MVKTCAARMPHFAFDPTPVIKTQSVNPLIEAWSVQYKPGTVCETFPDKPLPCSFCLDVLRLNASQNCNCAHYTDRRRLLPGVASSPCFYRSRGHLRGFTAVGLLSV